MLLLLLLLLLACSAASPAEEGGGRREAGGGEHGEEVAQPHHDSSYGTFASEFYDLRYLSEEGAAARGRQWGQAGRGGQRGEPSEGEGWPGGLLVKWWPVRGERPERDGVQHEGQRPPPSSSRRLPSGLQSCCSRAGTGTGVEGQHWLTSSTARPSGVSLPASLGILPRSGTGGRVNGRGAAAEAWEGDRGSFPAGIEGPPTREALSGLLT